jgi:hypothetical protein
MSSDAVRSCINPLGGLDVNLTGVLSYSGDGVLTTTYADDYIVRGYAHEIHRRIPVTTTRDYWVLDTTNVTSDFVFTLTLYGNADENQVKIDTYKIDSYTGGTEIPSVNPNAIPGVGLDANATFKTGVTPNILVGSAGDDLRQYTFGTQGQGNVPGGGFSSGGHAKVFSPGDIVCLSVIGTGTVDFEFNWLWYEI